MISSKYRFHSRGGVKYTYKNGQTIRHQNINLIYNKNTRGKQRFAAVVSKKILKSAVGRNRIRRRIYEAIRYELKNIKQPIDCIFVIYSKDYQTKPFSEIKQDIRVLLKQANIVE